MTAPQERPRPRFVQLVLSSAVLGVGVGLLLTAALGSDGYSTLVNGIARAAHVPFVVSNCLVAAVFVAVAFSGGLRPAWGTIIQPVVVGATVNGVLDVLSAPHGLPERLALLAVAFPVLVLGICGYLGSGAGAGPTEAAVLAFAPPLPFRWTYSAMQAASALTGWALGAALGVGTVLVVVLLGPAVDLMSGRVRMFDIHASAHRPAAPCDA